MQLSSATIRRIGEISRGRFFKATKYTCWLITVLANHLGLLSPSFGAANNVDVLFLNFTCIMLYVRHTMGALLDVCYYPIKY